MTYRHKTSSNCLTPYNFKSYYNYDCIWNSWLSIWLLNIWIISFTWSVTTEHKKVSRGTRGLAKRLIVGFKSVFQHQFFVQMQTQWMNTEIFNLPSMFVFLLSLFSFMLTKTFNQIIISFKWHLISLFNRHDGPQGLFVWSSNHEEAETSKAHSALRRLHHGGAHLHYHRADEERKSSRISSGWLTINIILVIISW